MVDKSIDSSVSEAITDALSPELGLSCLPWFWKQVLRGRIEQRPEVRRSCLDALVVVVKAIEPLSQRGGASEHKPFGQLCDELRAISSDKELLRRLGVNRFASIEGDTWLQLSRSLVEDPNRCLYCAICYWTHALTFKDAQPEEEWLAIRLTIGSLFSIGRFGAAAAFCLLLLGIERNCIPKEGPNDNPEFHPLQNELRRQLFSGCILCNGKAPLVEITLVTSTASALRRLDASGAAQALPLLEFWLGIHCPRDRFKAIWDDLQSSSLLSTDDAWGWATTLVSLSDATRYARPRGPYHAAGIIERWLGISSEHYVDAAVLQEALSSSLLKQLHDFDLTASVIRSLSHSLRLTGHAGIRRSRALLTAWLGAPIETPLTRDHACLLLNQPPLEGIYSKLVMADIIVELATACHPSTARYLIESFLGVGEVDYASLEDVGGVLAASVQIGDPSSQANLLSCLTWALSGTGRSVGTLLESWFGLSWPGDRENIRRAFNSCPLAGIYDPVAWANVVSQLAQHYLMKYEYSYDESPPRGPRYACNLIEEWLGIEEIDYSERKQLRRRLANSVLRHIRHPRIPVGVLSLLSRARASLKLDRTEWLEILRSSVNDLRHRLDDQERPPTVPLPSPSSSWESINAYFRQLKETPDEELTLRERQRRRKLTISLEEQRDRDSLSKLRHLPHRPLSVENTFEHPNKLEQVLNIIEAWLDCSTPEFVRSTEFCDAAYSDVLSFARTWLSAVGVVHEDALKVGDAVARFVNDIPLEVETFQEVDDYVAEITALWPILQRVWAAWMRASDEADQRSDAVIRLLEWGERFENRLLLERMRVGRKAPMSNPTELCWEEGRWGLLGPWDASFIEPASRRSAAAASDDESKIKHNGSCLDAASVETGKPTMRFRDVILRGQLELKEHRARRPANSLKALLPLPPQNAIWVRTMFRENGTLSWWALRRAGSKIEVLCEGSSQVGAYDRLHRANVAFDSRVRAIWSESGQIAADPYLPLLFRQLISCADDNFRGQWLDTASSRQRFQQILVLRLRKLEPMIPEFVSAAQALLKWLVRGFPNGEPLPADALDACRRHKWHDDEELTRRYWLDLASEAHLECCQKLFDLGPLWERCADNIDWENTNILFQVQGPLLLMPLGWLPLGNAPAFSRVASTGSIVSLSHRHLAEIEWKQRITSCPTWPPRRLLSVLWEDPEKRDGRFGLPLMQEGLQLVAAANGWERWTLGDEPLASVRNLQSAFLNKAFGVVVIAGHGVQDEAGILLSDQQTWCGEGVNLHDVDLLVLASCAVGRLQQKGTADVQGLCANLLAQHGRSVVAARWPISDIEAAHLVVKLVEEYLAELKHKGRIDPFDRARALNRARVSALDSGMISFHHAAAFEIYGLG